MHFVVKLCAFIALSFLAFKLSECHPTGAPVSVCSDLLPHHGVAPQSSKSPFLLKSHSNKDRIELKIESTGTSSFRGFAVQARPYNATAGAIGKFVPSGQESHTISCFGIPDNTITHSNRNEKIETTLVWIPPEEEPNIEVVFVGTVVQTGEKFWINIISQKTSTTSGIHQGTNNEHPSHSHSNSKPGNKSDVRNGSFDIFDNYLLICSLVLILLRKI